MKLSAQTFDLTWVDPRDNGYGDSFYRNVHFEGPGAFAGWLEDSDYNLDDRVTNLPSMARSHWNEAHNLNAQFDVNTALSIRDDRLEALKLAVAFVSSPNATGGTSIVHVADEFLAWLRKEG